MNKKLIVFPLLITSVSLSAQEPSKKVISADSSGRLKNEFSVNFAPVFRTLISAGIGEATRFSFTYKRNLNEKSSLRFSIMADRIHPDPFANDPLNTKIVLETDSVIIRQSKISSGYLSPRINIGYEQLFGKNKLKWFYGADLFVGYAKSRSEIQNQTLLRDTTQGSYSWISVLGNSSEVVSRTNKNIFSLGLSPFFGAKYPISKRFSISAQVGFDMAFINEEITETKKSGSTNYHVSVFDYNQSTGIINDISLIYKF